jgi:VWFA-related protein
MIVSSSRRSAAVLAALLLLPRPASAQQIPTLGETIEVSIVNLDVFVTDHDGNRVRGLTRDDFEIRENGKSQPITNFAEYSSASRDDAGTVTTDVGTRETGAAVAEKRERRNIVVFVERFSLPNFATAPMFASICTMLRQTVRAGDSVAIVSWSNATLVRQEFTDDLPSLERALAQIEKESSGVRDNPASDVRNLQAFDDAFHSDLAAAGFKVTTTNVSMDAFMRAKLALFRIRQKSAALRALIQSMAGLEGKKVVIMATHRFGLYAGVEYFGGTVPPMYRDDLDTRRYRDALTKAANANGVTLYPVYPEGLDWTPVADATQSRPDVFRVDSDADLKTFSFDNEVLMNETGALQEIASATGGAMGWGSKDIVSLMPRVAGDLDTYYSLAYRITSNTRKDAARKIDVTAKNKAYRVRSRHEFIEKSDTTAMKDRVIASLFRPLGGSLIPLDAHLGALAKTGKNRWTVPLTVRIPIGALTTVEQAGKAAGGFSVYVATGGVFGVIGEPEQKVQPFSIEPRDLAKAKRSHFTYDLTLKLDQVTDRVAIGVYDEVSREYGLTVLPLPEREVKKEIPNT